MGHGSTLEALNGQPTANNGRGCKRGRAWGGAALGWAGVGWRWRQDRLELVNEQFNWDRLLFIASALQQSSMQPTVVREAIGRPLVPHQSFVLIYPGVSWTPWVSSDSGRVEEDAR